MYIEKLVIGTKNQAKLSEWRRILGEIKNIQKVVAIGDVPDPLENGNTFEENARIKARHYAKLTQKYVFSEDGGYEIEALGGAPGVKSRRILPNDREGTDQELIDYVLEKLKGLDFNKRKVLLTSAVCVCDPQGKVIYNDKESHEGVVAVKPGPVIIPGYPFRSIHFIPELGKTYAELTPEEHEKYSHKRKIAKRFDDFLSSKE